MSDSEVEKQEGKNKWLEKALALRVFEFSVIPIKGRAYGKDANDAKHPLVSWKEYQSRRATEEEIRAWWKRWPYAAIGIVTGAISDLVVLDSDGEEGEKSLEGLDLPETCTSQTPRGGFHRYYRCTDALRNVKTTMVGLFEKVDLRGEGGYVVAPPSLGFNKTRYSWCDGLSPWDVVVSNPPEWLIDFLGGSNTQNALEDDGDWSIGNQKGWIADALSNLREGNRHETVVKIAGRLLRAGLTRNEAYVTLAPHIEAAQSDDGNYSLDDARKDIDDVFDRYPSTSSFPSLSFKRTETESESVPAVTLRELMANNESENLPWRINDLLLEEAVGILGSFQGYGKSWMLLDLAIECSRGGLWLGKFQTSACPVLYIDEESSAALLKTRLRKLLKAKNLPETSECIHFAVGHGISFDDASMLPKIAKLVERTKPGLVVIDALVRVHRANENSSTEMAQVFKVVKDLVREFKCSVLFADHHNKAFIGVPLDQRLRGTTEKGAFVDTLLSLKRKDDGILIVEHSKSRAAQPVPSFLVSITDTTPETTEVRYVGEAEPQQKAERLQVATMFVKMILTDREWRARKEIVEAGKKAGVSEKALDAAIKLLEEQGTIEREDRKPEGQGGKSAYYRWIAPEDNSDLDSVPVS